VAQQGGHEDAAGAGEAGVVVGEAGAPPLSKYLDGTRTPAQVHQAVSAEVNRAAKVINTGLRSLASLTGDTGNRRDAESAGSGPAAA